MTKSTSRASHQPWWHRTYEANHITAFRSDIQHVGTSEGPCTELVFIVFNLILEELVFL